MVAERGSSSSVDTETLNQLNQLNQELFEASPAAENQTVQTLDDQIVEFAAETPAAPPTEATPSAGTTP